MRDAKKTHRILENPLFWRTAGISLQTNLQILSGTTTSMEVESYGLFMCMKQSTAKHSLFLFPSEYKAVHFEEQIQGSHRIIVAVTPEIRMKHLDRTQRV